MVGKSSQDSKRRALNPLGEVSDALKGDVSRILHKNLPPLEKVAAGDVYDTVLDQPDILDESFKLFRARPELFESVAVDKDAQPVKGDDAILRCGRSVSDVIALVVRASAKRYFKRKLPPPPPPPPPKLGTFQQLMISVGLSAPPPPPKRPVSRADKLFSAIRDRLLYEWQALMIPAYSTLSPQFVAELGPHLLKFQVPEQLLALSSSPEGMDGRDGRPPLLVDVASRVMTGDGRIDGGSAVKVALLLNLGQLFGEGGSGKQLDDATAAIAAVESRFIAEIEPVLGHDCRLFVTFFYAAYAVLGADDFRHFLGKDAMPRIVKRWMEALGKPPEPTLAAMKEAYFGILGARKSGASAISG